MSLPENTKTPSTGAARTVWGIVLLVLSIVGLFIGVVWALTYYLSQGRFPVEAFGDGNLMVGAYWIVTGLAMLAAAIWLRAAGKKKRARGVPGTE